MVAGEREANLTVKLDVGGPHAAQPVLVGGAPIAEAVAALVLLHGRGGSAQEMLALARELSGPGTCHLAPQARAQTWYPQSFLAPLDHNEPWLSSALAGLAHVVELAAASGLGPERVVLLGFSQGACLTLEYAARNPAPYGALVGWSGGLIGPHGTPRDYPGALTGVPAFLGCSDVDPHIPLERVRETAETLTRMGADVDTRIYPGMGHTVNAEEVAVARRMVARLERAGGG